MWSPDGTQVAFYSNRSARYEIWTVNRDGSGLRQRTVTDTAGSTLFPVFSPDGRTIALSSQLPGSEASARDRVRRFALRDDPVPGEEMEVLPIEIGDAAVSSSTT